MKPAESRTNDALLMRGMERLTGFTCARCQTWNDYATAFDRAVPHRFPVALDWAVPIYVRMAVVASVMRPRRGMELTKALEESERLLCTNIAQAGAEALWFVQRVPLDDMQSEILRWMQRMTPGRVGVIANSHSGYGVIAAQAEVFA